MHFHTRGTISLYMPLSHSLCIAVSLGSRTKWTGVSHVIVSLYLYVARSLGLRGGGQGGAPFMPHACSSAGESPRYMRRTSRYSSVRASDRCFPRAGSPRPTALACHACASGADTRPVSAHPSVYQRIHPMKIAQVEPKSGRVRDRGACRGERRGEESEERERWRTRCTTGKCGALPATQGAP
jgi:hypothetical protein